MIIQLKKTVLHISQGATVFLNGLTSNSLDQPQNAFLTIHGRIVATFDQHMFDEEDALIVLNTEFVDAVMAHIERYVALSGVKVIVMDQRVYFDTDASEPLTDGDIVITQRRGRLLVTTRDIPSTMKPEDFILFRLKHQIPWHGVDFTDDMLLNVSMTDYVSFTKGCYLGQEPISKVYNRSKPTWKLVVRVRDECSEEERSRMTSVAFDPVSGKKTGFVFVKNV